MEEILTSAESEAKRTGNDGILVKGIISSAYPDMTFDVGEFKKFSKEDVSQHFYDFYREKKSILPAEH